MHPAGRRFGFGGVVYKSDLRTGLLETDNEAFAAALRKLSGRDRIEEVTVSSQGSGRTPEPTMLTPEPPP